MTGPYHPGHLCCRKVGGLAASDTMQPLLCLVYRALILQKGTLCTKAPLASASQSQAIPVQFLSLWTFMPPGFL